MLRLFARSRKLPDYRERILERFGIFKPPAFKNPIWVHAVSFGETQVAFTLIEAMQKVRPDLEFVMTSMTVTGSKRIKEKLSDKIFHVYVPYDIPFAIKNFLKRVQPKLLILIETEIWPNILHYCHQQNIPIMIANARLSQTSFKGYQRIQFFIQHFLKHAKVFAQTEEDAARFIALGALKEKVEVLGNIKFDTRLPEQALIEGKILKQKFNQDRFILIAASTHEGEEEIILSAFAKIKKTFPSALLILVPRHPERFELVEKLCKEKSFKIEKHSTNKADFSETDIYLGDVMGKLWIFYSSADVAFVGGSLIPKGGHNFLEPAAIGLPILSGPHVHNFKKIADTLIQAEALTIIQDEEELAKICIELFQNEHRRNVQGKNGQKIVQQNQGVLQKYLEKMS